MKSGSRPAAFFDLDGTLITENSARLWMQRERRLGRISLRQVLEGTVYLIAYRFHALDMDRVTVKALETIRGESEENLAQWIRTWFHEEVVPFEAPGARAALEEHRRRGEPLVLITSASCYESQATIEHFGMDAFLATRYEVKDGTFTGDIVRPLCYGEGKVTLAERYAAEHDIDLDRSTFYSDSFTDLPLLQRVGTARVVNPDLRLHLTARRRGWPVLDWSRPETGPDRVGHREA